jgi:predicted PurR-regulated permease PerM
MSTARDTVGSNQSEDSPGAAHAGEARPPRIKSLATATRISLIILASIAAIWALQWAKEFLIPLAVAIFATFWLMPLVDWLHRMRVPRTLGAAIVLAAVVFAIGGAAYELRDEARAFGNSISYAVHAVRVAFDHAFRDPDGWLHDLRTALIDRPPNAKASVSDPEIDLQSALMRSSSTAATAAVDITVVLFLMYLLLVSGDLFQRKLLVVISGRLARRRVTVEILHEIGAHFQRYLAVLSVSNIAIGFLTWAVYSLFGVEHAAVWGVAAGLLHLVPYVGPAVIAVASFLVSSVQFNSLSDAFLVALASLSISALIGMLLTTLLASRLSNMNSVAAFAGLMFWGWLWGIPGLLLGTPLIMATKVIAERVECLNWLATFLGGAPKRERKPRSDDPSVKVGLTESAATGETTFVAPEVVVEMTEFVGVVEETSRTTFQTTEPT